MNHEIPEPHEHTFYGVLLTDEPQGQIVSWGEHVEGLLDRPCGHAAHGGDCDTLCEDSGCY